MKVAWKLAIAYAMRHPARMVLSSLAMVASACIVVWVVSGYDALSSQFGDQAQEYLGRYDLFVVPEDPSDPFVDVGLVASLRKDPRVAEVAPVAQIPVQLLNPKAARGEPSDFGRSKPPPSGATRGRGVGAKGAWPPFGDAAESGRPQPGFPPRTGGALGGPGPRAGPQGKPGTRGGPGALGGPGAFRGFAGSPTLVGTDAHAPPYPLSNGAWIDSKHPERRGVVLSQTVADSNGLRVGDEALVIVWPKEYRVRVAGVIAAGSSSMMMMGRGMGPPGSTTPRTGIAAGPASSAVYAPMALAKHFTRGKAKVNLINIQIKPEAKSQLAEFRKEWEVRVGKSRPTASLVGVDDIRTSIEEGMMASRARQEAWAATGLSLLAALFIIFSTLSMGVTERVRQFAVMRAVGLSRGQVALIIVAEASLLALIGWAGGLLAGWGLLALVTRVQSELFRGGASLGTWCVALTGASALGGALAASVLPAWRATSVQPLEAMAPTRPLRSHRVRITVLGLVGLGLIAVNPVLVFAAPASMSSDVLYAVYMAVGCTTMAVGFLLLTPATIVLAEKILGPWVARALHLEPRLLRSQLGSNLWRTLGTTAALTVGLGLFAAMQIWGFSMLQPFVPGDWVPDVLVAFQRGGLPDAEIPAVRAIEGVRADQCIPLAVEQPKLASDITGSEAHASVIRQNNVIMIGLDPEIAFGGSDPLLKVRFVQGTARDAIAKLRQGRYCLVPDHFLRATSLKLGDRFAVIPPEAPSKRVEYTIAGAVALPGWHWMTKFSGLRRREGRSAAMVFADYQTVRRDFDLDHINFFWLNVAHRSGQQNLAEAKQAAVDRIGLALRPIAERNMGPEQPVNMQGRWPVGATMFGDSVRISTPDQIRTQITARASAMIWASCYLPLVTLLVTSLGVVNTVMASVRARQWEFGVLRSQGITRSGLFRMVLAEGALIGLITCLLSLGFGVLSGWCGTEISQHVSFFGGLAPPLVIPWVQLSLGFVAALGLCLLAASWPAFSAGRAEPLQLLHAGRAAM